jgi:hypothetical protein
MYPVQNVNDVLVAQRVTFAGAIIRQVLRRMPDAPDRLLIASKYSGAIEGRLNHQKVISRRFQRMDSLYFSLMRLLRLPEIMSALCI